MEYWLPYGTDGPGAAASCDALWREREQAAQRSSSPAWRLSAGASGMAARVSGYLTCTLLLCRHAAYRYRYRLLRTYDTIHACSCPALARCF